MGFVGLRFVGCRFEVVGLGLVGLGFLGLRFVALGFGVLGGLGFRALGSELKFRGEVAGQRLKGCVSHDLFFAPRGGSGD